MSISQKSSHQTHEAIVFFTGGVVGKEMLYTEFEALLDCVVPMRDFAGREMQAAYVRLDEGLAPVTVVLFLVPFDADGFPEQRWNVPLRQLAESGERGPDLGGGLIRLATRSQCPVPGLESMLWDVEFGAKGSTLDMLRERLRMNRLGLDATEVRPDHGAPPPQAPPAYAPQPAARPRAPEPARPAAAAASSDAMLALMQQSNQQVAMIKEQSQREIMAMQQRLGEAQHRLNALENEKSLLQQQLDEATRSAADEQLRAERKLHATVERARSQVAALRQQLEGERDALVAAREQSAREELGAQQQRFELELAAQQARFAQEVAEHERRMAVELEAREQLLAEEKARHAHEQHLQDEQIQSLRGELTELRRDKLRLMGEGADKFFAALKDKGVKFVAFQPGAGHLTIPMEELGSYLEDTESFVARKCGVSVENYRRWLAHYNNPVCQGASGSGAPCARPLQKLLKPAEFVPGMHDRCDIHKQVPRSQPLRDKSA